MDDLAKSRSEKTLLIYVTALTAFLRTFYVFYTPHWVRQHDVIGFGAEEGQAAYIEFFYNGNFLPDFDPRLKWGFFQPPLHHMLSALWIRLQCLIGVAYDTACENVQLLTLFYSFMALYLSYRILKKLGLSGWPLVISYTISAIHPGFILMSGSVNNDMLAILFSMAIIYYGLIWYEDPSWRYTLILAFLFGLGMMTKLSVGMLAPAVGFLFLEKWIKGGKKEFASWLGKYAVFALISVPLGLWYPVRNLIRFKVPIGYTPVVGEAVEQSILSRIFDVRVFIPYVSRVDQGDAFYEFNIFTGMIKYSLFGDQNYAYAMAKAGHSGLGAGMMELLGWALFVSGAVLALLCFYSTIRVLFSGSHISSGITRAYIGIIYGVSMIMYISFMIRSSYSSSMDFRYVLYLIPLEAAMGGLFMGSGRRWFRLLLFACTVVFMICTTLLFIFLSRA